MEMTDQTTFDIDARSGKDRRAKSGFNIRSLLFGGRREKIRRQEDTRTGAFIAVGMPVTRHPPRGSQHAL